jgi:hypothetical protein
LRSALVSRTWAGRFLLRGGWLLVTHTHGFPRRVSAQRLSLAWGRAKS